MGLMKHGKVCKGDICARRIGKKGAKVKPYRHSVLRLLTSTKQYQCISDSKNGENSENSKAKKDHLPLRRLIKQVNSLSTSVSTKRACEKTKSHCPFDSNETDIKMNKTSLH